MSGVAEPDVYECILDVRGCRRRATLTCVVVIRFNKEPDAIGNLSRQDHARAPQKDICFRIGVFLVTPVNLPQE